MTENTTKPRIFPHSWRPIFAVAGCLAAVLSSCTYEVAEPALPCGDVGIVSFAGDLLPLLDAHCTGCHSGGSPSAGLDLTSHDRVAESTLEGSLLERLQLPPSNIRMMPLNGNPLPECDVALFQSWAANGAPNN